MIQHASPAAEPRPETVGLMLSGGLDSALLLTKLLHDGYRVQPFYVSTGCVWEHAERQAIERFVGALNDPRIAPAADLTMPVDDLYGRHWSLTGHGVPDETTPDEAVQLPARNPLLLLKPLLWCGEYRIPRLALATLAANPFADARPQFLRQFAGAVALATGHSVEICQPFAGLSKADLLALPLAAPLHLTFSCLAPHNGLHCGACNKCAERRLALQSLPDGDPTEYVQAVSLSS